VDPSGAFVDDEPELEEQAITAPKSSAPTLHGAAPDVAKTRLILRTVATRGPSREPVFSST
jgi:hypothetical protein